ncbi:MAG TPA: hypothetical protein VKX28_00015 [Xanthobacteraceae bacterium]|nr:hypothetical protein [Xanthobacteraceae bacterium]
MAERDGRSKPKVDAMQTLQSVEEMLGIELRPYVPQTLDQDIAIT